MSHDNKGAQHVAVAREKAVAVRDTSGGKEGRKLRYDRAWLRRWADGAHLSLGISNRL